MLGVAVTCRQKIVKSSRRIIALAGSRSVWSRASHASRIWPTARQIPVNGNKYARVIRFPVPCGSGHEDARNPFGQAEKPILRCRGEGPGLDRAFPLTDLAHRDVLLSAHG